MTGERQQWINLIVILILVIAVLTGCFVLLYGRKGRPLWKKIFVGTVESAVFLALILWGFPYVDALIDKYRRFLEGGPIRLLLGTIAILLGLGAHVFKKWNKLLYGQVEVLFGIASAFAIASKLSSESVFLTGVALGGAAYIVARGFNNWSEQLVEHGNRQGHRSLRQNVRSWIFVEEAQGK